jgi:hypothetical protein
MDHQPSEMYDNYYNEEDMKSTNKTSDKRSKRPRYYPSNQPQTFIKNAVTGVPYPFIVGSKEQSLLYKIVDATGTCDTDGCVIKARSDLPNHTTNHLFYDSPEQCMSHLRLTLNPADVKRWHERHQGQGQGQEHMQSDD